MVLKITKKKKCDMCCYRPVVFIYIYIYKIRICMYVCMYVCLSVCSCLNAGLTAERMNLKFGMHTLVGSDCAIGYIFF